MLKGESDFRHLIIGWHLSEEFGLTIRTIRCGVCRQHVEHVSVNIDGEVFLTCVDGHLVGSDIDPHLAKRDLVKQCAEETSTNREIFLSEYEHLYENVEKGYLPVADLIKWETKHLFNNRRHFSKIQEFNVKFYNLMKEFKKHFYQT